MSTPSSTVTVNTNTQLTINTDLSKIFIRNNDYKSANYTNGGIAEVTLPAGTLLGRVKTTGKVVPLASAATDGSAFPVGILAQDYTVGVGATVEVRFCVKGSVVKNKVVFDGTDDFDTVVADRTLEDRIAADTVGILLIESKELTDFDNQ